MSINKHLATRILAAIAGLALLFGASACTSSVSYEEVKKRQEQAQQTAKKETLEKKNLERKLKLDEDANRIGYVYVMSFGKFVGYYTIKGKISSNGSQIDPEQLLLNPYSGEYVVTDGPQDDGTYGEGDPGIFFFTTEGTMVVTDLNYMYSTQPIPTSIDVPKLG